MSRPPVTGVILAGGQGSRFGGTDKGWLELRGRPFVAHVIERFAPQVDELLISANRNQARYAALGYPVLPDDREGFLGPLAGLCTSLRHASHGLVAVAPCDAPLLPRDLVARLYAGLTGGPCQVDVAVARTGGRVHPVFCLCHTGVADALAALLARGERRVQSWYRTLAHVEVDFDDEVDAFANVNTPEDLAALARRCQ